MVPTELPRQPGLPEWPREAGGGGVPPWRAEALACAARAWRRRTSARPRCSAPTSATRICTRPTSRRGDDPSRAGVRMTRGRDAGSVRSTLGSCLFGFKETGTRRVFSGFAGNQKKPMSTWGLRDPLKWGHEPHFLRVMETAGMSLPRFPEAKSLNRETNEGVGGG